MEAPLQLERSFFTKIVVEADPGYVSSPEAETLEYAAHVDSQIAQNKTDPAVWKVELCIQLRRDGTPVPYSVDLEAVGIFRVSPTWDPTRAPSLVRATGSSILYSSAREFLLILSGRLAWGEVQLPPWTFLPEGKGPAALGAAKCDTPAEKPAPTLPKARRAKRSRPTT